MNNCIDSHLSPCRGKVAERYSLSGSGMRFSRCDGHYDDYVTRTQPRIDEIYRRYPAVAPDDFDPSYAGERWDEDD